MAIRLFDLLGIRDDPAPRDAAAALWPAHLVRTSSDDQPSDPAELALMAGMLDAALSFAAIRPGAFAGGIDSGERAAVGLSAELRVGALPPTMPFVFAALPKIEFRLHETPGPPARIYIRQTTLGVEWIVEALPVEIRLPERLLTPLEPAPGAEVPIEATVTEGFVPGEADTLRIVLRRDERSSIFTHVRLRVSEQWDFVIEPAVPLSIGPCRFSGIPARAIHDLNFLLTPHPSDAIDPRAEALEWLRHGLETSEQADPPGFITVRTVDVSLPGSRLDVAEAAANADRPPEQRVEAVIEDLAIPGTSLFPVPRHFTAGLRRALGPGDDPQGLYKLTDHPVVTPLVEGSGPDKSGGLYLIVRQFLLRSLSFEPGSPPPSAAQFAFVDLVLSDDPQAEGKSVSVELTDEWTLEAGIHVEPPKPLFTLFGAHVNGVGARLGVSFKRLFAAEGEGGQKGLLDSTLLVGDLELVLGSDTPGGGGDDPVVKAEPTSGKATRVLIHDIGYRFGGFSPGTFWDPSSTELKVAGTIRASIDEFGFVTEPNGARYFSVSGSWPVLGEPSSLPVTSDASTNSDPRQTGSIGVQFYRLRWKMAGPADASDLLLDGVGLSVSYGGFSLVGSGMLSDRRDGAVRYREAGLAIQVQALVAGANLLLGGQFLHGRATGPGTDFRYVLAGVLVSPIPIVGTIQLVNLRGLFAWNMTPDLGPAGATQPMALFNWYKAHGDGVLLPPSRNISASGWVPKDDSYTFAAGAGISLGGQRALTIDAFFLYLKSPELRGFLAALQVFVGKGKKPIAYGAVELLGDRWSVLIGLAVGVENAIGKKVPFLSDAPVLTGTLYATNQPSTLQIGHVDDPSSWLAFHIIGDLWVFRVDVFAGLCLEIIDLPEGPRVFALRVGFSGGTRKCAIGGIDFYLTLELIAGVWRNESQVSGFVVWLEGGIDIDVLWVFQFGASVRLEWDYLGPDPAYRRVACEVHIHTPWWMPDKTFRWNRTIGQPELPKLATISTPVVEAAAHPLVRSAPAPIAVSPLAGTVLDEKATFAIGELIGLTPPLWPAETLAGAPPVAVDSVVALHFKPSVDDRLVFGQVTPPDVGVQASADVSTRYELVEIGIRRRPRFGPNAGSWTTLIAPDASRIEQVATADPADLPALFRSPVAIRWDGDFQREQRLDPRHLLLNAESPFLFFAANFLNDENLVRTMPGWPCCPSFGKGAPWHMLDFRALAPGDRAPRNQAFSDSASMLQWLGTARSRAAVSRNPLLGQVGRLATAALPALPFARIDLDQPAARVQLYLVWPALHVPRQIVIAWFRGLELLGESALKLSVEHSDPINLSDAKGITHILFRMTGAPILPPAQTASGVEFVSMGYQTVVDTLGELVDRHRCGAADPATGGNGGRFAWLPNHDYEVQVRTRVTVKDERTGTLEQEVPQLVFFRTKGLPGLNAPVRVGDEIEPYVESLYPAPGMPLYRRESAMLAFNERFDILQALDRPVVATDPAERRQRLDWVLAAELIAGSSPPARASIASADWIVAHRGTAPPPRRGPRVIGADAAFPVSRALTRSAVTIDPIRLRLDALLVGAASCDMAAPLPRRSRVLTHDPLDPAESDPAQPHRWPAAAQVRVNLRAAGSAFVDRPNFEAADATALTTPAGAWQVTDGMIAPGNAGAGRQIAVFGDAGWEHLQIRIAVDPGTGTAGIAIALSADLSRGLEVVIDGTNRRLVIRARAGGAAPELAAAALPADATAPFLLSVAAYDDVIRAAIGGTSIEAPRGDFRAGRLALVVEGAGRLASLAVDGLDAYRFEFATSRYDDFAAHIGSFTTLTTVETFAPAEMSPAALMQEGAGFNRWAAALALPLRTDLDRLEIGVLRDGGDAVLLLIESPEPLPLGGDVALGLSRIADDESDTALPIRVIAAGGGRSALAVPLDAAGLPTALPPARYRLRFTVDRTRYRATIADADSRLVAEATLSITL
jgi:hypothetical protein